MVRIRQVVLPVLTGRGNLLCGVAGPRAVRRLDWLCPGISPDSARESTLPGVVPGVVPIPHCQAMPTGETRAKTQPHISLLTLSQRTNRLSALPAIRHFINSMTVDGRIGARANIITTRHDNPLLVATKIGTPIPPLSKNTKGP